MKRFSWFSTMFTAILLAMFSISARPSMAQIGTGEGFTTTFPFYVGNAKLPAGTYRIHQSGLDPDIITIDNDNKSISTLIDVMPSRAEKAHDHSEVTFRRYGETDFIHRIWISGAHTALVVEPTKYEKKLAAQGMPQEHSVMGH